VFWTEAQRLSSLQLSLIRKVMESAPAGAINLALGELGFPMPDSLKDKAIQLLQDGNPVYTPNAGLPDLREAIALDYSCGAEANQVIVCNGAEEAVFITLMALLNPGDIIAIPDPDYPAYPSIAKIFDAKVLRLHFQDSFCGIDWGLWEKILSSGVKAVLLSTPSNPSGFSFSAAEAELFGSICNRYGIIVIVDEIYARLFFRQPPRSLQYQVEQLIRIGGLSKSHCMSGWRLGWILAPKEITPAMIKAKQYVSTCSHWLSQKLAIYALSPEGLRASESIRQKLLLSRDYFISSVAAKPIKDVTQYFFPDASPYVMLKIDGDDLDFATKLAIKQVITVPGRAFGESTTGWLRINLGVETALLAKALQLIS
jgi:aspartate/methionine/tyrosine aminotransferase